MSSIQSIIPTSCKLGEFVTIGKDVILGEGVTIWNHANLYGCELDDGVMVGSYTEIQSSVKIGKNTRISSHSFICSGTEIGERVFCGHFTCTINDDFCNLKVNYDSKDWKKLIIEDDCIIGSAAVLFPVRIGRGSVIGANATITKDVPPYSVVVGVDKIIKKKMEYEHKIL